MKKLILLLSIVSLLNAAGNSRTRDRGFQNWGIGGGVSLAVPDNGWGFYDYYNTYYSDYYNNPAGWYGWDYYWGGCTGVGPGLELKSAFRFGLGRGGSVHYTPSISWWARWEKVDYIYNYDLYGRNEIKLFDQEININLFDARYVPPVPRDFPIKPYVGAAFLGFGIYTWSEENVTLRRSNRDTDFNVHQNFMTGAEFQLDGNLWPYVEFKFSSGAVSDFLMTAGFTIQGRK